jgi:hypothetical protein
MLEGCFSIRWVICNLILLRHLVSNFNLGSWTQPRLFRKAFEFLMWQNRLSLSLRLKLVLFQEAFLMWSLQINSFLLGISLIYRSHLGLLEICQSSFFDPFGQQNSRVLHAPRGSLKLWHQETYEILNWTRYSFRT